MEKEKNDNLIRVFPIPESAFLNLIDPLLKEKEKIEEKLRNILIGFVLEKDVDFTQDRVQLSPDGKNIIIVREDKLNN